METILRRDTEFEDYEVDAEFPKIGHRVFALNGRRLEHQQGLPDPILLVLEDVTGN